MLQYKLLIAAALLLCGLHVARGFEEEDWGDGLRVLTTYRPENCEHKTKKSDVIHYHYVGRLAEDGSVFGKSFDYDSPYIVSLGHGRIIPGMDRGLVGMCLWERRRITFPPHLGYGERGVGQVIPPNSTLVFYVRLIKIERNGHALGEDPGIEELWNSGLQSYNEEKWQQVVDMVEEALRLFYMYQEKSFRCIKDCREEGSDFKLSKKERETVDKFSSTDPLVEQFLVYSARGKCIRECKANDLTPKLHSPDPAVINTFSKERLPYSYLQFSYYKLGNLDEGARCMFSYYFRHPEDDLTIGNAVFYRDQLGLGEEEFVWRDDAPGTLPHMDAYLAGRRAYTEEKWLQAADHFEQALSLYPEALERCQLLCEDIMNVNLTHQDMSPEKRAKFAEYDFVADTMEYYPLMVTIVRELLQCRIGCHVEMASNKLEVIENHLSLHFHYLQFCYYKLDLIPKAVEAAATHQVMDPSNEQMTANIQFYTKTYKLQPDAFTPRQKFVDILEKLETENKLLHFAEHGQIKKRDGQRGDSQAQRKPKKNEL